MNAPLPLRDVHEGIAPAWWPPAPGWWMVMVAIIAIGAWFGWLRLRARRRRDAVLCLFDDTVDRAGTPSQQVAAMSELLRRAARRKHAHADTLQGEAWLRVLDDGLPRLGELDLLDTLGSGQECDALGHVLHRRSPTGSGQHTEG